LPSVNSRKRGDAKYVGVKYPNFDEVTIKTKMALGEISVIYIYRNIYDVAESLNHKAEKGTENWKSDKN